MKAVFEPVGLSLAVISLSLLFLFELSFVELSFEPVMKTALYLQDESAYIS